MTTLFPSKVTKSTMIGSFPPRNESPQTTRQPTQGAQHPPNTLTQLPYISIMAQGCSRHRDWTARPTTSRNRVLNAKPLSSPPFAQNKQINIRDSTVTQIRNLSRAMQVAQERSKLNQSSNRERPAPYIISRDVNGWPALPAACPNPLRPRNQAQKFADRRF